MQEVDRNAPCPCGSGKQYKYCHLKKEKAELSKRPANAAHVNTWMQLALQHLQAGQLSQAQARLEHILQVMPRHAEALHTLGLLFQKAGNVSAAIDYFQKAINENAKEPSYHGNLGNAYRSLGRFDEAIDCFRRVLELAPTAAQAFSSLGNVLMDKGCTAEAIECFEKAITINPNYADAHSNLGNALQDIGKLERAVESYRCALALNPRHFGACYNSGNAYRKLGLLKEAVGAYQAAISIDPQYADSYYGLGTVYKDAGRLDGAGECFKQTLLMRPQDPGAHNDLGMVLKDLGKVEESVNCFQKAIQVDPNYVVGYDNLILAMQYLSSVTAEAVYKESKRYAQQFEFPLRQYWRPHTNTREPQKRLKLGYVSGDFRNHAVAYFIEPILASHDRNLVEIYCYSNHASRDLQTEKISGYADHWLACHAMNDDELAQRIRDDEIDILVDLSGHTGHNRLLVFARKPAPVQVTWIGYAGTTGLSSMDYRLTDAHMDPPGTTESLHSEALVRLPGSGAAYSPEASCPQVNPLPALTTGEIVFASLNNLTKINPKVLTLWGRILSAIPNAKLLFGNVTDVATRQRLTQLCALAGIAAERLILMPRMAIEDYLALHHKIDIALDPFPYNGGTTSMHSLWMGVPVIALAGQSAVSRVGVAVLSRVGLEQFIAQTEDEYFRCAVQIANDLPALAGLRQSLRQRVNDSNNSPASITRHLEAAYRQMWEKWCASGD